jgi:hypothetical protein
MAMGERQRFQSQHDRGRRIYSDDFRDRDYRDRDREYRDREYRDRGREQQQRTQPREWQPSEDYRRTSYRHDEQRDPRDRYASYYNDRQFGTRGRDEREQGDRYAAEEEWSPWPSDTGYAGQTRSYTRSRDYTLNRDYSVGHDAWSRDEQQHRPQYGDYERSYGWSHSPRSEERSWGGPRYHADNDYARDDEHESFGHQLREAGQKIARSVKRAFRGPKGYRRSDDRIREDVSDRLGENPWLDCSEVEVTVSNGEVTLTGSVKSRQEKFLLEEIADDVSGVSEVHNQVRVKREQQQQNSLAMAETAPGTQTSAEVAARVRNARA